MEKNPQSDHLLQVQNLTKTFPQVVANQNVSFDLKKGEIHCLLGENGAGKSTLAECLYGVYQPDGGRILLRGEEITYSSPKGAIENGIGMVHQHFVLVPPLTVIENIIVGTEEASFFLDIPKATKKFKGLCNNYGVELEPDAVIHQLPVGQQQWVEILKALYVGVDVLILDEPTAVLTPQEVERLFAILKRMRSEGISIILITHKLDEVMEVSDRVTVLRRGAVVETVNTADVDKQALARLMVGREVIFNLQKEKLTCGEAVLEVSDLSATGDSGNKALQDIHFCIHHNEILGLAGVSGNGQKELFDVLVGVRPADTGAVKIRGEEVNDLSPRQIMEKGLASIPQDRILEGLVMNFRIEENLILGLQRKQAFRKGGFLSQKAISDFARLSIEEYGIATPSSVEKARVLSGGNLQKVILARELSQDPAVVIASQPTRGLDVGAIEYVHQRLLDLRSEGAGILLISEELDELFTLADRIAVIYKGTLMGIFKTEEITVEEIGLLMAGIRGEVQ